MSREEASNRQKEMRYQHLMDQFRKIDIREMEKGIDDQSVVCAEASGNMESDDSGCDWTGPTSSPAAPEEDDWTDYKPSIDIRTFNFNLEGILCPYCKASMMISESLRVDPPLVEYKCQCGFLLKSKKCPDQIKAALYQVLQRHGLQCPDRAPEYSMLKTRIVVVCSGCSLFTKLS